MQTKGFVCVGGIPKCVFYPQKIQVSAPSPSAPFMAVRVSGTGVSNFAVGLIDARGPTANHWKGGSRIAEALARTLLVASKENKQRDIRALFQQ